MKKHVAAWIVALTLISSGFLLAGCPEQPKQPQPKVTICIENGEPCDGK